MPTINDTSSITVSSRINEFSYKTWWMVDLDVDTTTQGATPLVSRCMKRYSWSEKMAKRVLKGYKQFLWLKLVYDDWDATLLSPSTLIDQMWHEHILDVQNYCHDMMLLCGRLVGHNPNGMYEEDEKSTRRKNTKEKLKKHFKNKYDPMVWKEILDEVGVAVAVAAEEGAKNNDGVIVVHNGQHQKKRKRESSGFITLFVKTMTGKTETHHIHSGTKISHFFELYSQRFNCSVKQFRHQFYFLIGGKRMKYHSNDILTDLSTIYILFSNRVDVNQQLQRKRKRDSSDYITIFVRYQSGKKEKYRLHSGKKLTHFFRRISHRVNKHVSQLRFLLDGERIKDDMTLQSLSMIDGDQIDVMLEQTGC